MSTFTLSRPPVKSSPKFRSAGDYAANDPTGFEDAFGQDGDWADVPEREPLTIAEMNARAKYFGQHVETESTAAAPAVLSGNLRELLGHLRNGLDELRAMNDEFATGLAEGNETAARWLEMVISSKESLVF